MKSEEKTNVMRIIAQKKVWFESFSYPEDGSLTGEDVAAYIGVNPSAAFKTLVTVGKSGAHYVFDVPVNKELDLKKAALAVGEKNVAMVKCKELLPLTGYIHGGCSPVGMKKFFTTTFDETVKNYETIYFSGGRIGSFIAVKREELCKLINYNVAPLTDE